MLEAWHIWVLCGLALWILELFTGGFVIGVFGTACLITAPLAGAGVSFKLQLLSFGVATAVMSLWIRPLVLRYFHDRNSKTETNVDALVGQLGMVVEVIDDDTGTGSVRVGGEVWRAVTTDGSRIDAGEKITVRKIEGSKVVVESTSYNNS